MKWPVRISGMGTYLPTRVVTSDSLIERFGPGSEKIVRKNGVRSRRWAEQEKGETAAFMAARAAELALEEAGLQATEVDLILNASGTQMRVIPDGGPWIQQELGLGESGIPSMSVHATCLGFFAGLDMASVFLQAGRYEKILLVASEVAHAGVNPADVKTVTLFGDGAAAAVLERAPEGSSAGLESALFRTYAVGAESTSVMGGGTLCHPHAPHARHEDMYFKMDGPAVMGHATAIAPGFFQELIASLPLPLGEVDCVISHQPSGLGLTVLGDVLEAFGCSRDKIVSTIATLGNCVAASIPLTLHHAIREGHLKRGQRALLFGTGAGLSMAGGLLTY